MHCAQIAVRFRPRALGASSEASTSMALIPEKTLQELGWPRLVELLVEETRTPVGRELTRALPFLPDRDAVQRQLGRVAEARRLAGQALEIPVGGTPDEFAGHIRTQIEKWGKVVKESGARVE